MSLGFCLRALFLLGSVAAGTGGVVWLCVPALTPAPAAALDAQLGRVCALALLAAWAWLAVGVLLLVGELLLTGRVRWSARVTPPLARLLVGGICGVGIAATTAYPATAASPDAALVPVHGSPLSARVVEGLPLPDRTRGPAPRPRHVPPPFLHVVAPGDTLWAVAQSHGVPWTRLYAANRAAVGDDPDLIRPGLPLVVPAGTDGGVR